MPDQADSLSQLLESTKPGQWLCRSQSPSRYLVVCEGYAYLKDAVSSLRDGRFVLVGKHVGVRLGDDSPDREPGSGAFVAFAIKRPNPSDGSCGWSWAEYPDESWARDNISDDDLDAICQRALEMEASIERVVGDLRRRGLSPFLDERSR